MRQAIIAASFAIACAASPAAAAVDIFGGTPDTGHLDASLGVVLSTPELAGLAFSWFPNTTTSVDLRLTTLTADVGGSAHLPIAGSLGTGWRHDVVVNGMVGYVHRALWHTNTMLPYSTLRFVADAGYGLLGPVDLRLTAGVSLGQHAAGAWAPVFTAMAVIAKTF